MAGASPFQQLFSRLLRSGAPLTFSLLTLEIATFLLFFLASGGAGGRLLQTLAFSTQTAASQPWTVVTYIFAWPGNSILLPLCVFFGLYYFASALERGMGTPVFTGLMATLTVFSPLALWAGAAALQIEVTLASAALPIAAVIVGWATRYPESAVMLWFVVPVKAKWLGWFTAAIVALGYGWGTPALSLFALFPLAIAHFWVKGGLSLPVRTKSKGHEDALSAWERQRKAEAEKLRLKELLERSYRENEREDDAK